MNYSFNITPIFEKAIPQSRWIEGCSDSGDELSIDTEIKEGKIGDSAITVLSKSLYSESIMKRYRFVDSTRFFNKSYLTTVQKKMKKDDRNSIVRLILNKIIELDLNDDIAFLTIKLFDFILGKEEFSPNTINLHGCTCIIIASKMEDLGEEILYDDFSTDSAKITEPNLVEDELYVLKLIDYNAFFVTPLNFLKIFVQKLFSEDKTININRIFILSRLIAFCSLLDDRCSAFSSEMIASECLRMTLNYYNNSSLYDRLNIGVNTDDCHKCLLDVLLNVIQNKPVMEIAIKFSNVASCLQEVVDCNL